MHFRLILAAASLAASANAAAATITLVSDGSTLGGVVPVTGAPLFNPVLLSGDTAGVTFGPVEVGAFGSRISTPANAPTGVEVINLGGDHWQSGFFEVDFTLPANFTDASITGAANADDYGAVFLNGNLLGYAGEFGTTIVSPNPVFGTSDATAFRVGQNQFIVSDDNGKSGPSGAVFFAEVNYDVSAAPEPSTWALILAGVGVIGYALRGARPHWGFSPPFLSGRPTPDRSSGRE